MKNEKKNKQGEPAMTQPKGANELSDDVLEAVTGGAQEKVHSTGMRYLLLSYDDAVALDQRFKFVPLYEATGGNFLIKGSDENYQEYVQFLKDSGRLQ